MKLLAIVANGPSGVSALIPKATRTKVRCEALSPAGGGLFLGIYGLVPQGDFLQIYTPGPYAASWHDDTARRDGGSMRDWAAGPNAWV